MNNASGLNIYGKLLGQILFQGMSRSDLESVVTHLRFGFHTYSDGDVIVAEGEPCDHLMMLTEGCITTQTAAADKGYVVYEEVSSPQTLQLERLFGLTQRYSTTCMAKGKCHLIMLGKEDVLWLAENFMIFRLNIFNILSTYSQKSVRSRWAHLPGSLRERIVNFLAIHCCRPAGVKRFRIKMTRLADELNDSRLNVSRELNRMQSERLINLTRGMITVPAMEKLIV